MMGDKIDDIFKFEFVYEVEYSFGKYWIEGVRGDCSCNDGIRFVFVY